MEVPEQVRLPDAVTVRHGPVQLLSRFFLAADQYVRDRGVRLVVRYDMDELLRLNKARTEDGTWYPLPGAFNPALNTFAPGSVYWVCGLDENGEIAVAQSARRYDWPDSSMCDHGSELLYGDLGEPRPCYFDCPPARLVRGTVSFSGALWIRPDFRRRWLGGIVAQISRTYALATWGTDWLTSLLQRHQLNQGLHLAYGFTEATFSIKYPGSPWGDLDFALLRQHPLELVAFAESFVVSGRRLAPAADTAAA